MIVCKNILKWYLGYSGISADWFLRPYWKRDKNVWETIFEPFLSRVLEQKRFVCNSNREIPMKTPFNKVISSTRKASECKTLMWNWENDRGTGYQCTTDEDGIITTFELHLNNSRDEIKRPCLAASSHSPLSHEKFTKKEYIWERENTVWPKTHHMKRS